MTSRDVDSNRRIALERIERLFELADKIFKEDREKANRYVKLAWRIATHYNIRTPRGLKLKFCRKCLSFWKPNISCRVRIKPRYIVITCLQCGRQKRLLYKPKTQKNEKGNYSIFPSRAICWLAV